MESIFSPSLKRLIVTSSGISVAFSSQEIVPSKPVSTNGPLNSGSFTSSVVLSLEVSDVVLVVSSLVISVELVSSFLY